MASYYEDERSITSIEPIPSVEVDWTACELVERVPGKVSGRPVVRGTRIFPDSIVNSFDLGDSIEEIHEGFPSLSISEISRLIEFAHSQQEPRVS